MNIKKIVLFGILFNLAHSMCFAKLTKNSTTLKRTKVMNDLKKKLKSLKSSGEEYFDRAVYYKKLGRDGNVMLVPELRMYYQEEENSWAKSYALAALVKLRDSDSHKILMKEFGKVLVDDIDDFVAKIQYIGQKRIAIGFLSWLEDEKVVRTLGHRQNAPSLRLCDYGVWNAHLLGVEVNPKPTHLTNFDNAIRDKLSSRLRRL
jgi:hypothetical protein